LIDAEDLWKTMLEEARMMGAKEPALADFLNVQILQKPNLVNALANNLSSHFLKIPTYEIDLEKIFAELLSLNSDIVQRACKDVKAYVDRDPACDYYVTPLLFYKGFQALQLHRICHSLWSRDQRHLARYLQSKMSENYGVDIHPGAIIGGGVMLDHATSLVIGETAVIGDNVSILHSVTLGGSGLQSGDRHPKIANGVLIAAGATVLGNIDVGEGVKIGAGSLVLESVPAYVTVAGVPAKIIGGSTVGMPALDMNQQINEEGI
tara:strand:- start:5282 stop:6073 length:792 start_codon:yes stop_codon:yes gene_type:complete